MNIYHLSTIGAFHINHNEDAFTITEIDQNRNLIAVMDGCSMGKESHFASTLITKLLRKISKEISYRFFIEKIEYTNIALLREVLSLLFLDMAKIKNQLLLEEEEVLSTLILGILDKEKRESALIIIGDGLVCCNGIIYEYEQNDKPDYLGYHLLENFDDWFNNQTQKLSLKDISDLSIATDGVFTFRNFDGKSYPEISENEIINRLLINRKWHEQENMLTKKKIEVEKEYGKKASDDLTLIRVIF